MAVVVLAPWRNLQHECRCAGIVCIQVQQHTLAALCAWASEAFNSHSLAPQLTSSAYCHHGLYLQQYLHTLDPTRDQALVNKSDDVLLSSYRVPKCWWSPVPNRGMVHANVDGRGTWMRKEALEDQKKQ
jgi:hypothetical protein